MQGAEFDIASVAEDAAKRVNRLSGCSCNNGLVKWRVTSAANVTYISDIGQPDGWARRPHGARNSEDVYVRVD